MVGGMVGGEYRKGIDDRAYIRDLGYMGGRVKYRNVLRWRENVVSSGERKKDELECVGCLAVGTKL